jgi:hypothetical protein
MVITIGLLLEEFICFLIEVLKNYQKNQQDLAKESTNLEGL